MSTRATVRFWRPEKGWGVVDAPAVPGGCYVNFTAVATEGYRTLAEGSSVNLEFQPSDSGSFRYVATRVWPEGAEPFLPGGVAQDDSAYSSSLAIEFDEPADPS